MRQESPAKMVPRTRSLFHLIFAFFLNFRYKVQVHGMCNNSGAATCAFIPTYTLFQSFPHSIFDFLTLF